SGEGHSRRATSLRYLRDRLGRASFPTPRSSDPVERIEILSDGASALYGSDAIGGVVNIILRKDFEGVEVRYGIGILAQDDVDHRSESTRLNSSHVKTSYAVFCLKKKTGRKDALP